MAKLLEEMKAESDSESAEYIDQKVELVQLKQQNKVLTDRVKSGRMELEA